MKTLAVTSPFMKGAEVLAAQTKLATAGFYHGTLDGEFGPQTGAACVTAKRVLGYTVKNRTPVYGTHLDQLLDKFLLKKALPLKNRVVAKRQVKKSQTLGQKALAYAISKLGVTENPPGSNRVWATLWYGLVGAWCAISTIWSYTMAGSKYYNKTTAEQHQWPYVPNIVSDARRGLHGLSITHAPQAGDLVCYDWPGESPGLADHVGIFEAWVVPGKTFTAIEGNTSAPNDPTGSQSDGGGQFRRTRDVSLVQNFVHVAG